MGTVQQITKDNNGKCTIECQMEPSDVTNQPDIHSLTNRLSRAQVNYWTAQQVAEYLQTMPSVVSKLTGTIIVTTGSGRRENNSRINVGFSWKANRPVKQVMDEERIPMSIFILHCFSFTVIRKKKSKYGFIQMQQY
jgi:hypothetical protein